MTIMTSNASSALAFTIVYPIPGWPQWRGLFNIDGSTSILLFTDYALLLTILTHQGVEPPKCQFLSVQGVF